ncbi:hypothetical protein GCM10027052_09100 [Parafrigoribacterium mesophilum]|uniref:fluoride efflux transporter CrcB n=1 Tax=Parafrigoribacterium mesophilum TaxID=433646 RepID=UPI0031FCA19E
MSENIAPLLNGQPSIDGDLELAETPTAVPRPVHLHWRYLGLVLIGGSLGTAARYLLSTVIPDWHGLPLGTFAINVSGAFALGVLLESLIRRGADEGMRRTLRLLVGTGILGGFTTYSSFSVDTTGLLANDHLLLGLIYSAATLCIGAVAAAGGIVVGAAAHGWRPRRFAFMRHGREVNQ